MFGLGTSELIVILVIVMILFGAGRLPEIGSGIGKGIRNFKRAAKGEDEIEVSANQASATKDALKTPASNTPITVDAKKEHADA